MRGIQRLSFGIVCVSLISVPWAIAQQPKPDDKKEEKKGAVVGVLTGKADNWIEVKADGEEKARRYTPHWLGADKNQGSAGLDKKMLAVIKELKVDSRVRVEWEYDERARVVKVEVLKTPDGKEPPKKEEPKDEEKKGTVTGKLTAKEKNWVEVQADGEEKARRYYLRGKGTPELVKAIEDATVNSRVRIEWEFFERPRVMKLEVIKAADKDK
jgi:hypothetical protein